MRDAQARCRPTSGAARHHRGCVPSSARSLLARALNATQDAVLIADEQAQILFCQPGFEDPTGYRSDEVRAHAQILQSGEHHTAFYAQLREALERGDSCQTTFANRRKDRQHFTTRLQTITPLKDEAGATQALRQRDQRRDRTGGIAH